jgi:hypothetical protein
MIAEAFHPADELATKSDLALLQGEVRAVFADLRAEIHKSSASTMRWMLTFFIPVWAGTWATVVAVLLKG